MKLAGVMIALVFVLAGCADKGNVFIALDSDFASFRSWPTVALGSEPLPGHPPGPRYGYLSHAAPRGATAFPVGTMIVKTIEPLDMPATSWEVFAMAKRGGGFNANGARDWEFFRLRIVDDSPVILTRGIFAFDPDSDAGVGYGSGGSVLGQLCNSCHGIPESAATDHVLSEALRPGL